MLCGLRDRCIAAMLATLVAVCKDRDTKAELNRRNQACEVLADTGTRVARNGLPSRSLGEGWPAEPKLEERRLESRAGTAPASAVLQTAA